MKKTITVCDRCGKHLITFKDGLRICGDEAKITDPEGLPPTKTWVDPSGVKRDNLAPQEAEDDAAWCWPCLREITGADAV